MAIQGRTRKNREEIIRELGLITLGSLPQLINYLIDYRDVLMDSLYQIDSPEDRESALIDINYIKRLLVEFQDIHKDLYEQFKSRNPVK